MRSGLVKGVALTALASVAAMGSPAAAKPVSIMYWGMWSGIYSSIEKGIIDNFNKEYEGRIVVKTTSDSSWGTGAKILTSFAAGLAPDVFKINRYEIGSYAARDLIAPLDSYIKKDKVDPAIFFKGPWNESTWGGKVYGIPWNTDSRALYYNKTLFRQVGLDPDHPPKTWEETAAAARKIDLLQNEKVVRAGIIPHGGNWYFAGWLWSAGGTLLDETGRKCVWNSAAGTKALEFMADAIQKYGGATKMGAAGDLWGGKVGMEMNGSWALGDWRKTAKKFELGVGVPPRPAGLEDEKMTWGAGFGMAIPKGAKHPKEAWEFIKYYTMAKEAQLALTVPSGQIPTLKAAATDPRFLDSDPLVKTFVDLLPSGRNLPVCPAGPDLWALYSDSLTSQLVAAKKSPQAILDSTVLEGQKLLDKAWKRVRQE